MKCVIYIFITSLFFVRAHWDCPADPILPNSQTENVFPTGGDLFYGPSVSCKLQITVPAQQYAQLMVNANPDAGDSIFGQYNYIQYIDFNGTSLMAVVGPVPFVITIQSTSTSKGYFQVKWSLRNVTFANQKTTIVKKGAQPNIFGTYALFQGAQTFTSADGGPLAISTASFGKLGADFKMTGAFVYQGTEPTGSPIACLYNRIDENVPLQVDSPVTVVYFTEPKTTDSGAIAVSSWSDVKDYAQLKFIYYDNLGSDGRFVVDGTNGTAAVMLFQNDNNFDTLLSYIITNASTNCSLYAGGVPLSENQLLSTYGVYMPADNAMPQWIPGKLKTFVYTERGSVSFFTNPSAPGTLPARADLTGFYKSANYPFSDTNQDNSLYFQSNDPLTLTLTYVAGDATTAITVNTTGITGPQTCILPSSGNNCSLYGTNFRFSSQSTASPSTGALINYYFTGNETTTTSPKNAGGLDILMTFVIVCAFSFV